MKTGQIYIIKNKINDLVYIGQTTNGYKQRFLQHCKPSCRTKRNYKLYNALNFYGVSNFYVELLEDKVPVEKLFEREIFYIKKYNSYKKGYNSTNGGNGNYINRSEDIEYITDLYMNGKSTSEIAKMYNVSYTTIFRLLKNNNIKTRADGNKYSMFDKYLFISLWSDKTKTLNEIASRLNVHPRTVKRYANRLGLEARHLWSTTKKR